MSSLKSLQSKVARRARKRETRDLSAAFGEELGTTEFTWQEPDTAGVFSVFEDAAALKKRNPTWPESLAASVAEMAVCHVSPRGDGDVPASFYAAIANNDTEAFALIFSAFRDAFPAAGVQEGIEEAKND